VILVDTSVWIDYLGSNETEASTILDGLLTRGVPTGLTSLIYQELLQGTSSEETFDTLKSYLDTQIFYHPQDSWASYANAAALYAQCRRAGITLRSTVDCLIAQISIENGLWLLHNDKDFDRMAQVVSDLQLFENKA